MNNNFDFNSVFFGLYKYLYEVKVYTKTTLQGFVKVGTLSANGYKQITGDVYE